MKINIKYYVEKREYYENIDIWSDVGDYGKEPVSVYTEEGFIEDSPELGGIELWYIRCRPEKEEFSIHIYIPVKLAPERKFRFPEEKLIRHFKVDEEVKRLYESELDREAHKYPCLEISKIRVRHDREGEPQLVCVIPARVFGEEKQITAKNLNKLDALLEKANDDCPREENRKYLHNLSGGVIRDLFEFMRDEPDTYMTPDFVEFFSVDGEFGGSPREFENLIWGLIDMAILGSSAAREFARYELCEILDIQHLLWERNHRDELFEELSDEDDANDENDYNNNDPETTAVSSEPTVSSSDMLNEFDKIIRNAISRIKKRGVKFSTNEMCLRGGISYVNFSRIRNGIVMPERRTLMIAAVCFELTPEETVRFFGAMGMKYPVEMYEKMIDKSMKDGITNYYDLLCMIPKRKKNKENEK